MVLLSSIQYYLALEMCTWSGISDKIKLFRNCKPASLGNPSHIVSTYVEGGCQAR
jgi:hypothetical protein